MAVCAAVIAFSAGAFGQTVQTANVVKWRMVAGTDNEAFFAIPEDGAVFVSEDYFLGPNRARVDDHRTVVSDLGGSIVQLDLFRGAAEYIRDAIVDEFRDADNRPVKLKEADKNGFRVSTCEIAANGLFVRKQFIRRQDRLYVITGASRQKEPLVIREFFESVMLVNGSTVMSPNQGDRVEESQKVKMLLPRPFDRSSVAGAGNVGDDVVDESAADVPVVVVFRPMLQFPPADSRFVRTFNQVKVKVLLKGDGTVGSVEAVNKTTPAIEKEALQAARNIKFLPAERGGKPVSVYKVVDFSLSID